MATIGTTHPQHTVRDKTVAAPSQKGGVGKSTLTAQIAHTLAQCGLRILVVDLDANGGISAIMGATKTTPARTVADLVNQTCPGTECVYIPEQWQPIADKTPRNGGAFIPGGCVHLIPTGPNVADTLAIPGSEAEARLRQALTPDAFGDEYDLYLVDLPGGENATQRMAMHAAQYLLLPLGVESVALRGFSLMLHSAFKFARATQLPLDLIGGVVPQFRSTYSLHQEVLDYGKAELSRFLPDAAWIEPPVPAFTVVPEANASQIPVAAMNPWRGTITPRNYAARVVTAYIAISIYVAMAVLDETRTTAMLDAVLTSDLPATAKTMIRDGIDASGPLDRATTTPAKG